MAESLCCIHLQKRTRLFFLLNFSFDSIVYRLLKLSSTSYSLSLDSNFLVEKINKKRFENEQKNERTNETNLVDW